MKKKVLITGGAGFIGSHLADELLNFGYEVRALDNLSEQVHGKNCERPEYLNPAVELQIGDVRDKEAVKKALDGVDMVVHFAAMVGVGQSMYQICDYTSVNNLGTAVLLEALIEKPVEKLLVASSMSIYGEGLYQNSQGEKVTVPERQLEQLKTANWELHDENGNELKPVPTPESKTPTLSSVYALSKYDQERLCLMTGRAYNIPTVAMRFFNVYGTRQALSNPYTGVLAIFASRFLNDNPPMIFEDGYQQRDFVHVKDVALACRLALEKPEADGKVFNVGSGNNYTIREIAERLAQVMGKENLAPQITGKYRVGDIRHCYADISLAKEVLGFYPQVDFNSGLQELAAWLETQIAYDNVNEASAELAARGLTV
ncbi:MAG: NAD-dependent epimerase/dehydratase family protein [Hymenobacteraceae bacterium]|nr:NAD-dependent epimerase/dehydratase family protein [Hymenobacteraceae bacterium]MDX5395640.1 NAD-dependent epimerase/dehydratase family protein [Hymenobacteraceae bacterium]MDX5442969.1 NAD-dependent epimerase/dehydratase family protein [Hymenobacteraceae bacterium]MDX5511694.1 NAD-dependent epimerase/dehydratase family protein [Hymenobacteraceae bacterium]